MEKKIIYTTQTYEVEFKLGNSNIFAIIHKKLNGEIEYIIERIEVDGHSINKDNPLYALYSAYILDEFKK